MAQRPTAGGMPRGLGRAATLCFAGAVVLGLIAGFAPPPGPLSEPPLRGQISRLVVIVRENGTDRVTDFLSADMKSPTYTLGFVSRATSRVSREIGFDSGGDALLSGGHPKINPGLYHRSGEWRYELLDALRLDRAKATPEAPDTLDGPTIAALRPRIAEFLNARGPDRLGDQFEAMLKTPLTRESSWCWQNVCAIGAYGLLLGAWLLGIVWLFVKLGVGRTGA